MGGRGAAALSCRRELAVRREACANCASAVCRDGARCADGGYVDQITLAGPLLDPAKFRDPAITAKGETRAVVGLRSLDTLWFNTGTLCNLTCATCYIESSPRNDRLADLKRGWVRD